MPGFVIFVLVLTFAYVVYFSVMITLDLHSKKDEKKTDEETFDVSSMDNEEVPVSVEEHNNGPEGSDMTYTEQVTDDGLRVVIPTGNKQTNSSPPEEEESQLTQHTTDARSTESTVFLYFRNITLFDPDQKIIMNFVVHLKSGIVYQHIFYL